MNDTTIERSRRTRTKLRGWRPAVAALSILAMAGLSLSLAEQPAHAETGSRMAANQTLKMAIEAEPPALEVNGSLGAPQIEIFGLIHRGLMTYNTSGKVVPALAKSVKVSKEQTYTFSLYPDEKFSDGTPLTSANVRDSLEYYANPVTASDVYAGMSMISSIDTPSASSVVVHLKTPSASFLQYLADPAAAIVPESALTTGASAEVGAGPFRLVNWDKGIGMTLQKNPYFYAAKKVRLQNIDVSYDTDNTAMLNALTSGQVQWIDTVPWQDFDTLKETPGVSLSYEQANFQYLMFNQDRKGPLQNPLVREAIAYAINRTNSVQAAFYGYGANLYGIPYSGKANENLWSYNPKKAKALLKQAGYPDGFSTSLLAISGDFYQDMGLSIQADLGKIGIKVSLVLPDLPTRNQMAETGDYDMAINGTYPIVTNPLVNLQSLVTGPPSIGRSWGYNDPTLDKVISTGINSPSASVQTASLNKAAQIVKTNVPVAFFNFRDAGFGFSSKLKGFKTLPKVGPLSTYSLAFAYLTN